MLHHHRPQRRLHGHISIVGSVYLDPGIPDIAAATELTRRQATVEDLDPPPALSSKPTDSISTALMKAYERDYTHLTVVSEDTRALLGYLSIPRLKELLKTGTVKDADYVKNAMQTFRRRGNVYKVITMDTPLEELEAFFNGGVGGSGSGPQDFAVVTGSYFRSLCYLF